MDVSASCAGVQASTSRKIMLDVHQQFLSAQCTKFSTDSFQAYGKPKFSLLYRFLGLVNADLTPSVKVLTSTEKIDVKCSKAERLSFTYRMITRLRT